MAVSAKTGKKAYKKLIVPPLVGIFCTVLILGVFNAQYLAGRISYAIGSQTNITPPDSGQTIAANGTKAESQAPQLLIAKIKVKAPVIYNDKLATEDEFQLALRDGVLHFPQTGRPGQRGNNVIIGHSSGSLWRPGNYKFVFSLLGKLEVKDTIQIDYEGIRYTYEVSAKEIVEPDQVSVLAGSNDYRLTLITCYPVGTNKQRLVITAKQISPKPVLSPGELLPTERTPDATLPTDTTNRWQSLHNIL